MISLPLYSIYRDPGPFLTEGAFLCAQSPEFWIKPYLHLIKQIQ